MILAAFFCLVASVHDGDTFTCSDRTKVRIAGVQAPDFTDTDPCKRGAPGYICDNDAARRSQRIIVATIKGKTLYCRQVDKSWSRAVAVCTLPDGGDLSCSAISSGAAVRWDRYWRRYRMAPCPH